MASQESVNLEKWLTRKWNEMHPNEKEPEFGTKEFVDFCDEVIAASQPSTVSEEKKDESKVTETDKPTVTEDDKHRYTKVDRNYIRKALNDWVDDNPGKTIGLILIAGCVISCKVFQRICTKAVYKGNLRTIKYLMKHRR